MRFLNKIRKLAIGGKWYIACRKENTQDTFTIFQNPKMQFCADPIPFTVDGHTYVFCEQFRQDKKKGCIGYFEFSNGIALNRGIVLERPYHLSYPFVFQYADKIYMIPETSEAKDVELYIADEFPSKWTFVRKLLAGNSYVDTTVEIINNVAYFVTYYKAGNEFILERYKCNSELTEVYLLDTIRYPENTGRGAGKFFEKNGMTFRPSQDCISHYGAGIFINKVDKSKPENEYTETRIDKISVESIVVPELKNIIGVHTLGFADGYEIIDVFSECFDPTYNIGCIFARKFRAKKMSSDN